VRKHARRLSAFHAGHVGEQSDVADRKIAAYHRTGAGVNDETCRSKAGGEIPLIPLEFDQHVRPWQ
jgi:hypothetical protein